MLYGPFQLKIKQNSAEKPLSGLGSPYIGRIYGVTNISWGNHINLNHGNLEKSRNYG